jgi:atypical dual specificity phosphatase
MITRLWERIFIGNLADAEGLARVNPLNIRTVLTLCPEQVAHAVNVRYSHIGIADSRPVSVICFESTMLALGSGVHEGKVLVHCVGGMSRSPIMVAAWMHRCGYAEIERALAEIAELRDIDPSPVLLHSVKERLNR